VRSHLQINDCATSLIYILLFLFLFNFFQISVTAGVYIYMLSILIRSTTHLSHQGIEGEGHIATHDLKSYTKENPYQHFCQIFMEARVQLELILQSIMDHAFN
jgi:hypothetical protein